MALATVLTEFSGHIAGGRHILFSYGNSCRNIRDQNHLLILSKKFEALRTRFFKVRNIIHSFTYSKSC